MTLQNHRIINHIVWLETQEDKEKHVSAVEQSKAKLCRIVHSFETFLDIDEFIDYVSDISDEKTILVILPLTVHETIVAYVNEFPQVNSIYVVSWSSDIVENYKSLWVEQYSKIKYVICNVQSLYKKLRAEISRGSFSPDHIRVCVVEKKENPITSRSNNQNNQRDKSYIYTGLFRYIGKEMKYTSADFDKMLQFLRSNIRSTKSDLEFLDKFARQYQCYSPIWWYTQPKFLYKVINESLYKQDFNSMHAMRIFIKDLNKAIVQLYETTAGVVTVTVGTKKMQLYGGSEEILTLYRGRRMLTRDLKELEAKRGAFLCFCNFLSTSTTEDVALMFAGDPPDDPNISAALFIIKAKSDLGFFDNEFANISALSSLGPDENEYLFTMGCLFRIEQTFCRPDGVWCVHLSLTSDTDPTFKQSVRDKLIYSSERRDWGMLAKIMYEAGDYLQAEQMFSKAMAFEKNPARLCELFTYMTSLSDYSCNMEQARLCSEKVYETLRTASIEQQDVSESWILNVRGMMRYRQGHYIDAINNFQQALDAEHHSQHPNNEFIGTLYINLGNSFAEQGKQTESLSNYQRAFNILHQHAASSNQFSKAAEQIGIIHSKAGRYSEALHYWDAILHSQKQLLVPNNSENNATLVIKSYTLFYLGRHKEALDEIVRALDMARELYSEDDDRIKKMREQRNIIYNVLKNSK